MAASSHMPAWQYRDSVSRFVPIRSGEEVPKWIVDKHFNSHMPSLEIIAMKCTEVDKEGGVLAATVTCRQRTEGAPEVVLHVRVDNLAAPMKAAQHEKIAKRLEAALLVALRGGQLSPQMPPPPPHSAWGDGKDFDT